MLARIQEKFHELLKKFQTKVQEDYDNQEHSLLKNSQAEMILLAAELRGI